jgi:hypothetical protein
MRRISIEITRERLEAKIEELVALLDLVDGDENMEDGGDTEPSVGSVGRYGDGRMEYDLEDDPAESGIADDDALNLFQFGDDWSGKLKFDGDGHHIGRKLLRDKIKDQRKLANAMDATRVSPGYGRFV